MMQDIVNSIIKIGEMSYYLGMVRPCYTIGSFFSKVENCLIA
jgi:hypothetical protein